MNTLSTSLTQNQYSLRKILSIWLLGVFPMPILAFLVAPMVSQYTSIHPGITYWMAIIVGMMWMSCVALVILFREGAMKDWKTFRERIWLQNPLDPKTGKKKKKLFWWIIPMIIINLMLLATPVGSYITQFFNTLLPFLNFSGKMDISQLATPEFIWAWWLVGIAIVSSVLNYALAEELFFHGVLLPKMKWVFGNSDWIANSALFGMYHMHKFWDIPMIILSLFAMTWPSAKFRSIWFSLIIHGIEGIVAMMLIIGVVSGKAF